MVLDTRITTFELHQLVGPVDFTVPGAIGDLTLQLQNTVPPESRLMTANDVDNLVAARAVDSGFADRLYDTVMPIPDRFERVTTLMDDLYSRPASDIKMLRLRNPLNISSGIIRGMLRGLRGWRADRRMPYFMGDPVDDQLLWANKRYVLVPRFATPE